MSEPKVQLIGVLGEATSQDYSRMKQAEALLKEWENSPSFFATLQDIFYDRTVDYNIRTLSGIYLKNGIDRFWRRTAKNPILPEEKKAIRERLLQFMEEPSKKLTTQNAVIISRIARLDYPRDWPDLLTNLIRLMDTASAQDPNEAHSIHSRILETLSEVLSELSTRLLSSGRQQFAQISPTIFQAVAQIYVVYVDRTIIHLQQINGNMNQEGLLEELNIVATCVKCMRVLMVSGVRDVHKYDETRTFLQVSRKHLEQYSGCRCGLIQINHLGHVKQSVENIIEEYGSLYVALQKRHPVSAALCPAWLDIIRYYWQNIMIEGSHIVEQCNSGTQDENTVVFEPFLLQGMLLIKDTIKNVSSNAGQLGADLLSATDEEKELATEAGRLINEGFLTPDFVNICAETLVSQYMLMSHSDFNRWEEDPEGWFNNLDIENWEFELKACAELVFMNLLSQYRDQLVPIMLTLVERVATVTDKQSLLFKDAVYNAVGLGVNSLFGKLDFEPFVMNRLVAELENKNPNFKVLRRRIAWLLGRWVTESISADCRKVICETFLQLMTADEDLVVRLTAASGLKQAVDDWDFDISTVVPYLGSGMSLLLALLKEVEESDTTLKVISYINAIIDRTGADMIPFAAEIVQLLISLWGPHTEPLLQSSLVVTFTKITSEAHIYLLEDSLDLWWTILQSAPASSPDLISLLPTALDLLDYDTENLRKTLLIIDSYIMLDPQATLQPANTLVLFTKLASKIGQSREQAISYMVHTLDLALQSVPLQMYVESLVQSGLLTSVLRVLVENEIFGFAIMNCMNLFARISIYDASVVLQVIQLTAQQEQISGDFLNNILDKWIEKFENVSQERARKLACIGFTNLVLTGNPVVLSKLPSIMDIWTSVGPDLKSSDGSDVLYSEIDLEGDIYEIDASAEKSRKHDLSHRDPVYTIDLIQLIRQTLNEPNISTIANQVDATILEKVKKLLN
ncbi:hypothetical protein [Parasitella parasitica]|uniref:Importin N-terminal domain-containing protein n=1 Tax=Parasitella parasitica TaxID=35722 RepID=A0A0B7NW28_9FUNG|nr:hypothetical protein [Parasitella parasitica]